MRRIAGSRQDGFSLSLLLGVLLALPATAGAQQPPPEAPPPSYGPAPGEAPAPSEAPPPAEAPPPSEAPPPGEMQPPGQAPVNTPPPPPKPVPMIRIRAGANGALALFVPGPSYGSNFSGRIGIQIKKMFGVYGDFGGGFGLGGSISASAGGGGVSINIVDYWRLSAMGEFDIGPFFIAVGPTLFKGAWGGISEYASQDGAVQVAYAAAGYFPALLGRIGLSFGRRHRFTIAVENMVVFGEMTSVSQSANQSGASQSFHVGAPTIGWAPALMLGWDMR